MAESRNPGRRPALLLLAGLLAAPAGAASAQETVYIGGTGDQVEINLDVLDSLGTPPNVAGMLRSDIRRSQAAAGLPLPLPGETRAPVSRAVPMPPPSRPATSRRVVAAQPALAPAAPKAPAPVLPSARRTTPAPQQPSRIVTAPAAPRVTAPVPSAPKVAATPAPKVTAPARVAIPAPAPAAPKASATATTKIPDIEVPAPPSTSTRTASVTPPPPPPAVASTPATAPAKAPAAKAPEPAKQIASAPPAPKAAAPAPSASGSGAVTSVIFETDSKSLPGDAETALKSVAEKMKVDETIRVQLMAYASAGERSEAKARRLSLSRALEVRSYLIGQGIASTRMDVRALGDRAPSAPSDRVDLTLVAR
ncbi:OmpA family protein [Nisaea acidiphila]|uniref:OmpA family protein n=1 Tax=Nisaea acidiphila TaxID=1862145 RepID=A0A9J7AWJ3_9PROT|nr:OmpA family protein [Nisaea acidiphila]UUX51735.1 OmpA family protein [Nisaea acidiphila]